jgi:hypothetical protein
MYQVPTPSQMFSDANGAADVASRFEQYKTVLAAGNEASQRGELTTQAIDGHGSAVAITKNVARQQTQIAERVGAITKALTGEQAAALQADIDALKGALGGDLNKDWSVTFARTAPGWCRTTWKLRRSCWCRGRRRSATAFRAPRARAPAASSSAFSAGPTSGVGGVADAMAFMNSESVSTAFGPISLRRPPKINYASDSKTVAYVEQGLSDSVTWKAQFAGMGFQDIRSLSQTALLWATMGGEERALLFARGANGNGYAGAVAAPVISGATATTGGTIAAGTYQITVTARAGGGESVISNRVAQVTTGATSTITVTVATEPTGALGYNLYVSAGGRWRRIGNLPESFVGNTVTLTAPPVWRRGDPGCRLDGQRQRYDGFLTVQADPTQSGYVKRVNGSVLTLGDAPWQDAFVNAVRRNVNPGGGTTGNKLLADPDEIWLDGQSRNSLAQWIKVTANTVSYRLVLNPSDTDGGAMIGAAIGGIVNQTTGKMVPLEVHPYMPLGCSLIRSTSLPAPVPDSNINGTAEVRNVQDYMSVDWPTMQMTYDLSTYWYGTLVHYAPAWSGALLGLLP